MIYNYESFPIIFVGLLLTVFLYVATIHTASCDKIDHENELIYTQYICPCFPFPKDNRAAQQKQYRVHLQQVLDALEEETEKQQQDHILVHRIALLSGVY